MCGIVGFFDTIVKSTAVSRGSGVARDGSGFCGNPGIERAVRAGMSLMAERGPDDEGIHFGSGVVLGHRRLAIIDPEGGRQPFVDEATGVALVFNGEIFNYRSLRTELQGLGHQFRTQSDTEVLLRSYMEWGEGCPGRLQGMFAFAVYDPRQSRLLLVRDRLGIKPLYYSVTDQAIVFASTIPAIRCFPQIGPKMDMSAVSHYLTTIRTTLGRQTLFRDVKSLLPGEYLLAECGKEPEIRTYWEIPMIRPEDKIDPGLDVAAEQIRELVIDSVERQLISDVPLGGFLSGGVDSSVLASTASRLTSGQFSAYSIGYDREGYNEWPFVRAAAEFNDMDCRMIHLREESFPDTWTELVRSKGLPVSTPNEIALFHLATELRRDFTVALSGEGADELFGGYVLPYFSAFDYDRARRSQPAGGEDMTPVDRAMQRLYRRPYLLCRPDHYFLVNSWIPFEQKMRLLADGIWEDTGRDEDLFAFYEGWFDRLAGCTTMDAYMHVHARVNLEGLLSRVDSSTMAASVEARVPFADHRIAEYMFSLPDSYRIDWKNGDTKAAGMELNAAEIDKAGLLESKRVLRKAFCNDVEPGIMKRPKASFPVPFREWASEWMNPICAEIIATSELPGALFDDEQLARLLNTADQPMSAMALWPVVNLCLWQRECGAEVP